MAQAIEATLERALRGMEGSSEFQCSIDDPPGYRNWWTAEYLHVVTDEAIDVIHANALRTPTPGPAQTFIIPWGGPLRESARTRRR